MKEYNVHFEGDISFYVNDEDEALDEFSLTDACAIYDNINYTEVTEVKQ